MADDKLGTLGGDRLSGEGNARGVYGANPAAQLNYYNGDYVKGQETQARLYVTVPYELQARFNLYKSGLKNGSAKYVDAVTNNGYIDFLMDAVSEQDGEKFQPVDLLSDEYVAYFFGRQPRVFSFSGTLYSTIQDPWWTAFTLLYQDLLRGSKLAQFQATAHLRYDNRIASGSLTMFQANLQAATQMAVTFSAQLLVKDLQIVPSRKAAALNYYHSPTEFTSKFVDGNEGGFNLSQYQTAVALTAASNVSVVAEAAPAAKPGETPQQTAGATAGATQDPANAKDDLVEMWQPANVSAAFGGDAEPAYSTTANGVMTIINGQKYFMNNAEFDKYMRLSAAERIRVNNLLIANQPNGGWVTNPALS